MFWKIRNDVETQNETEVASEKTTNQLEQILQNLEDESKKAKTIKKSPGRQPEASDQGLQQYARVCHHDQEDEGSRR